jgi:hypothetical protein
MSTTNFDEKKQQETRFEMTTEQPIDGHTLGPASTHDTEKGSSGYAASILGEDHKVGLLKAERKLLLKLGT